MLVGKAWPKRYSLVTLCFCAAFICYVDRVNISVAAIAMKETFGWSETMKGFVLSSFFVGYLAMQVAGGWLAYRFGGKLILGCAVIWWSIFTILTPMAAFLSLSMLIITRIALGLGEAAAFPASFALFSKWIPAGERSRAIAILLSGAPLGTVVALLATGWIVERFGWPSVFYLFGAVGFVWACFWFWLTVEQPAAHPRISKEELELLQSNQYDETTPESVPWKLLFSKRPVWALIINHFCTNWTVYMLVAWLPSYFRDVHDVSIINAGFYSAAPWLTMFIMMNIAGWFADTLLKRGIATIVVRKFMQCIGLFGAAIFLILARDIGTAPEAMLLLCGALGLLACTFAGFAPNALELAPRYSGILAGITNTVATIPGIIGVIVTGWLVDVTGTYTTAFVLAAAVNVFGAMVWLAYATTQPVVE
jgi:MFS transporter, ACS family, solute carrier family 17 (sodium-dependent inorganic phosphate cotransporter), other